MRSDPIRWGVLGVIAGLICAGSAGAQQVSSLEALQVLANTNTRVTVTDNKGQAFRGTVVDVSERQLGLRIAGAVHQFPVGDIRSVRARKEDTLRNGALIGAAIAGGLTSLVFLDNECRDDPACYAGVAIYTGLGALAGVGVDALIRREVLVYAGPAPAAPTVFTVSPFVVRGRRGVRLTIEF